MSPQDGHRLVAVRPRLTGRTLLSAALLGAVALALLGLDESAGFHPGGGQALLRMGQSLVTPDLSPAFVAIVAEAAAVTIAYAVTGMSIALLVGLPGAVLVSGVLVERRAPRAVLSFTGRGVFGALRAVHELVWALLLLTVLGLTPLAGVLAIGIPYGATLARVLGEHLQNVPRKPVEALSTTGASRWQQLAYARVPLASADIVAYLAYRFECAVRAAAVLSFIGLGGIGYRLTLSLHDLRFDRVWTLIAALVAIIAAIDLLSGRLRRTMTV